jgi:transcriptional regulator of NAD metabolism
MNITGGTHYHTIRAENEAILDATEAAVKAAGYLAD